MLEKTEHIGIMVSDMDRAIHWYTTVLGLPLKCRVKLGETTELAFLPLGDSEIELVCKQGDFTHSRDGVVNHVAFTVNDIAPVLEHLRSHGVELVNQAPVYIKELKAYIAFFRGPDGELFELFAHDYSTPGA